MPSSSPQQHRMPSPPLASPHSRTRSSCARLRAASSARRLRSSSSARWRSSSAAAAPAAAAGLAAWPSALRLPPVPVAAAAAAAPLLGRLPPVAGRDCGGPWALERRGAGIKGGPGPAGRRARRLRQSTPGPAPGQGPRTGDALLGGMARLGVRVNRETRRETRGVRPRQSHLTRAHQASQRPWRGICALLLHPTCLAEHTAAAWPELQVEGAR